MAKERKNKENIGLVVLILVILMGFLMLLKWGIRKDKVDKIETDGKITLASGRQISLYGIQIKTPGEDGHESAMFLLTQMAENKEVWIRPEGGSYLVWIGCFQNMLGWSNCKNGVLLNKELERVGVAEKLR